ncbi:CpaF family protein [Falsiroseomonas sp.]|uniref:CpaF family protein n=1 Tax=Falsiroseomonas sp. TaxID=2870721 RepID=UPI0035675C35
MRSFGRRPPEPEAEYNVVPLNRALVVSTPAPQQSLAAQPSHDRVRSEVMERVDPAVAAAMPLERLRAQLEALIDEVATRDRLELTAREQVLLAEELARDMVGYGPLEPLLRDDSITDIMVNGPNCVYVERRGLLSREPIRFRSEGQLNSIAQKIAATVGRRVDESNPMVDCRLPDGSRVNVVFAPLSLIGTCISIRKFSEKPIGIEQMIANGSLSTGIGRALEIAGRSRLNILISGGTGSGKTTLMNAISRWIDPGERIVTIEDAAELRLQQPHVIPMETRVANLEGRGEITQRDLLRNALRMRPDRIIVGEVRGAEAFDMLQAMNTGHDGSFSTVHANAPRDALTRLENMMQMAQAALPQRALRLQIASALDLIVQVQRMRDGQRRVTHVTEVCGMEGEVITLNDLFTFRYTGEGPGGRLRGTWISSGIRPSFFDRLEYFGLDEAWTEATQRSQG